MEKVKKFGAHVISYLTNAAVLAAGVSPAVVPAEWLPYIGAIGLLATGAHNVQVAAKPGFDGRVGAVAFIAASTIILSGVLGGCSFLKPENAALHQVAVQYATGKYIEAAGPDAMEARACKVLSVSDAIAALATDDTVTLDSLESHALQAVAKAEMTPADRILANTLVAAVVAELRARVDTGVLSDQDRYRVGLVLGWVKQAAGLYVPVETGS